MQFSRARYVTLCQQSLVTGAVLVVGISAAGVKTLDIVPQPDPVAGARDTTSGVLRTDVLAQRERPRRSRVDTAPVTPKVREVKVTGIPANPAAAPESTASPAPGATARRGASETPKAAEPAPGSAPAATPKRVDGKRLVALSEPQPVKGYATVGVTWEHGRSYTDQQLIVQVRTEKAGVWSGWLTTAHDEEDGPDVGSGENVRPGTDALVIGDVDQVQMRAASRNGETVPDLKLAVIDPGTGPQSLAGPAIETAALRTGQPAPTGAQETAPQSADGTGTDTASLSAMTTTPQPYIYSRAQWGANERMRDQSAPGYGTVKAGFIHHTVNANSYTADQVPALLRGIYAYHTQSRGWRDIGYNYLVDRFGRIWEGRYGGITRAVVGAHTLGYNEVSFAMSAIGNYDIASPPTAVLTAYAKLFAWKLSLYGIRADATRIYLKDRYVQAINGHRDVGQTACPGRYLYAKVPYIRQQAQAIQDAAQGGAPTPPPDPTPAPEPTPDPAPSNTFTSPTQTPITWRSQSARISFPTSTNLMGAVKPDLVMTRSDGTIDLLPTGGQVGFSAPVSTPGHWNTMNLVAAVGDVTGDGKGDVLARLAKDGSTRVYRGDGAGHFAVPGVSATSLFRFATAFSAAGDWNRDGKPDVLMKDRFSRLWMIPGLGNGRFGRGTLLSRAWGGFTSTAVPGDLTGDGRPDLAAIHRNGNLYVVASTRTGALGTPVRRRAVGTLFDSVAGGAGDLTGDGRGDIVVHSSRTGQTAVLPGAGSGRTGPMLGWFAGTVGMTKISAAQVAGSRQADVVGVNSTGTALIVLPHNGMSNYAPVRSTGLRVPGVTQVLGVGDWNRDGRGDVITRQTAGDSLVLRPGLGNGRFAPGIVMGRGWRTITQLAAVGDVTGDRVPDLAGRTAGGPMRIFPGNGHSGFLAPRTAPASLRTFNLIGGGAWEPATSGSSFLAADGSFVPASDATGGRLTAYDWVVGPGDVDGDGRPDLITRDSAGCLWLLPGTSRGVGPRRLIGTGFKGYQLGG